MAEENPRIADLRRRVERDPASIAFAQLAEEYRRDGRYDDAIEVCSSGLARYPGYLSARVTLGRALMDIGRFDQARQELQRVLDLSPDNVAAKRAVQELRERQSSAAAADLSRPIASPPAGALEQLERWLDAIRADRMARHRADAAS